MPTPKFTARLAPYTNRSEREAEVQVNLGDLVGQRVLKTIH